MNITSALTINNFNMVTVAFIQSHIGCMYKFHISTVPLINGAKREIKRNETHTHKRRAWSANDVDLHLTFCSFSTRFDCGIELNDSKNLYTNELREVKKTAYISQNTHKSFLLLLFLEMGNRTFKSIWMTKMMKKSHTQTHTMRASTVNFKLLSNWRCKCYIKDKRMKRNETKRTQKKTERQMTDWIENV